MQYIVNYFKAFLAMFVEMSPYLLFGFLIAGILHIFITPHKLKKIMGKENIKSSLMASFIGVPLPLCSCGVIPTGISFYKNGASKGATVSFLISTPQTGVDSILVTYSLLGLPFAIIRPIVALVTGVLGGIFTSILGKKEKIYTAEVEDPCCSKEPNNEKSECKIKKLLKYAFVEFLDDISFWLIIGLLIAALITVALPNNFFTSYISNRYLSMLIVLLGSIPLYVCATSSVPIAVAMMLKGLSPGAALVFLMAGPATNAATITVLSRTLGKRGLLAYIGSIVLGAVGFGTLIDLTLPKSWFTIDAISIGSKSNSLFDTIFFNSSAIIFAILLLMSFYRFAVKRRFKHHHCNSCVECEKDEKHED